MREQAPVPHPRSRRSCAPRSASVRGPQPSPECRRPENLRARLRRSHRREGRRQFLGQRSAPMSTSSRWLADRDRWNNAPTQGRKFSRQIPGNVRFADATFLIGDRDRQPRLPCHEAYCITKCNGISYGIIVLKLRSPWRRSEKEKRQGRAANAWATESV